MHGFWQLFQCYQAGAQVSPEHFQLRLHTGTKMSVLSLTGVFFLLPSVLSVSVELGSTVLVPNKDKVCFAAEVLEYAKNDDAVKVRFLATKEETSVEERWLLEPSEWLVRDELVLIQEPGEHGYKAGVYEEAKIVDIVNETGQLPRYRVRVEAPSVYHKMIEMQNIGVSQKKVEQVRRTQEQVRLTRDQNTRLGRLLMSWLKTTSVGSIVLGTILSFLFGPRKRCDAAGVGVLISFGLFCSSLLFGSVMIVSHPDFYERYFAFF